MQFDPSDTFFTSDTHFKHAKVADVRGYSTIAEHDEEIYEGLRSVLKPTSVLFHLGDLVGRRDDYATGLARIAALPGRKYLITGNHDAAHPVHVESLDVAAQYAWVFTAVQPFAQIRLNIPRPKGVPGLRRVLLSHFPYHGDGVGRQDRWTQFRLPDHGQTLLHGHTHRVDQCGHLSDSGTPQVHVGLDAWDRRPVSLRRVMDEILELESAR